MRNPLSRTNATRAAVAQAAAHLRDALSPAEAPGGTAA
jgi:hypothetical protein